MLDIDNPLSCNQVDIVPHFDDARVKRGYCKVFWRLLSMPRFSRVEKVRSHSLIVIRA